MSATRQGAFARGAAAGGGPLAALSALALGGLEGAASSKWSVAAGAGGVPWTRGGAALVGGVPVLGGGPAGVLRSHAKRSASAASRRSERVRG
jgi:hypothetical protein